MLDILISGPGLIGEKHARLVHAHPDCRIAAIVAPLTEANCGFAEKFAAPIYEGLREALDTQNIDGAIISSPNEYHFVQTMECIERKIPSLVEKPITDNVDDALTVTEVSERAGVAVLVGHHRMYSPLLVAADNFLRSEAFGSMVGLQGAALFYKPRDYFIDGPWRTVAGGGPILINLIHEIGLMRHFAGEVMAVQAFASRRTRRFAVEDTVSIAFEFKSGALGSFLLSDTAASSKSWEMTSGENPAYPYFPTEDCWHFAGTHGSLDFPSMHARTYRDSAARSWWRPFEIFDIPTERRKPLELQFDHFVEVIRNGVKPKVSARDGYRNLLVVQSILEAISAGVSVSVEDNAV